MNFFEQMFPLMEGTEKATITIQRKGDKLTIGFLPEVKNEAINKGIGILSLTGTPEELDGGFFEAVTKVNTTVTGITTNVEEIEKNLKSVEDKKKGEAAAKSVKKEAPKKDAKKSVKSDEGEDDDEKDETDSEETEVEELKPKEVQSTLSFD